MDEVQNQTPQTPPQPVAPQAVASPDPSVQPVKSKSNKSKIILGIILFVVLVVVGVGGWWYYAFGKAFLLTNSAEFPWGEEVKNYKTTTDFKFSVQGITKNEEFTNEVGGMFGPQDSFGISGTIAQQNISDNFSSEATYVVDYGDAFSLNLAANFKLIDSIMYINPDLTALEALPLPFELDLDLKGTWVEVPGDMFVQDDEDSPEQEAYSERFDNFIEKLEDMDALGFKDPHETKDSSQGKLMKVNYTIDGTQLDGIVMASIESGLTSAYDIVPSELSGDELNAMISGDKEEFEKFKKENEEQWELMKHYLSNITLSAWINTKTKNIQVMELVGENLPIDLEEDKGTMSFTISSFYEPIEEMTIEKPTDTMTAEELMTGIMTQTMGGGMMPEQAVVDTDGDGLSDDMEFYYGTEVANPDTDGDGYLDGEEVLGGYNPNGEGLLEEEEDLFGGEVFYNTNEEACVATGGTWGSTDEATNIACAAVVVEDFEDPYDGYDTCEKKRGCRWDLYEGKCASVSNYCSCSSGTEYYISGNDLFVGCQ